MRINLGSSYNLKEGWVNMDIVPKEGVEVHDARLPLPHVRVDYILINHVLCTMNYDDAKKVLKNAYNALRDGGTLQVIDMDLIKAYESYRKGHEFPVGDGTLDFQFCMHVSGYSTRLSLYTREYMKQLLEETGFSEIQILDMSEYDTRPDESLILKAVK